MRINRALACAGKSVLHLDVNDYYGASWASFNYTSLLAWVQQHQSLRRSSIYH
jgi:RAB protein geranylgeranyltransferase component A